MKAVKEYPMQDPVCDRCGARGQHLNIRVANEVIMDACDGCALIVRQAIEALLSIEAKDYYERRRRERQSIGAPNA